MKSVGIKILKIVLPLGLGVFLIWLVAKDLTAKDIEDIKESFQQINYTFIFLSVVFGILSHISRAWRWKYPLNELGYEPKFINSFFTVMIGYFVNLGIPRSGEVARCGIMARYENIPVSKLIGTVIAERVADLIILVAAIFLTFLLQLEKLQGYISGLGFFDNFSFLNLFLALALLILLIVVGLYWLKKSSGKLAIKVKEFVSGVMDGVVVIATMKKRWLFVLHTAIIWIMYFLMHSVAFYSLPGTAEVPFSGIFTTFVIGGISIAATNGGIGAYPLGISAVLLLYGVAQNTGYAFGWAVWTAQTVMVVALGAAALVLMPRLNKT